MWSLSALNYYTRDLPDDKRTVSLDRKLDIGFYEQFSGQIQKTGFTAANNIEFRIKTQTPLRGTAHGENIDLPTSGSPAFTDVSVPLREVVDVAGVTKQALDRATGMPGSWGSAIDDAQNDMINVSFKELLRYCFIGNGTGYLGTIHSAATCSDANGTAGAGNYIKLFLDNVYNTSGWDNTHMCQVGMSVEIADSTGTTATVATNNWGASGGDDVARLVITKVHRANRANGASANIDGTDGGYIVCAVYNSTGSLASSTTLKNGIAENDLLFRQGSVSKGIDTSLWTPYPRGLFYYLSDGTLLTGMCGSDQTSVYANYCGKPRASYASLQPKIYQGGQAGYLSGTGTPGTPEDWDLSDVSDACIAVEEGTGKGKINLLMCNKQMGLCLGRKTKDENSVQVVVNSTGAANSQAVSVGRIPKTLEGPDGQPIALIIDKAIPNNCIVGMDTNDFRVAQKGNFDYYNLYGGAWGPTKDDRKGNFEAFYGGYMQTYAYRLDNMFLMQDLLDNI